ncbi:MAG: HAD-IC family P-type ATPase, partial [Opitutaceae bacterium]|nr:HAD-IC family P-type ATPase [Opitutaceae bacterium]
TLPRTFTAADETGLILSGYIAFLDPPRETAAPALRLLQDHGIAVKILTGDSLRVARRICREVGLDANQPLTGADIDTLDDDALRAAAARTTLFAKLEPAQKARVVTTLKKAGHTVGFMGDGINDAPALREADVGISVEGAAAREAADIILLEKNLLVLERGGRRPPRVRQHHKIPQDDHERQLRQRHQRARGQHIPALPADDGDPPPHPEPPLRPLATLHPLGHGG